MRNVILSLLEAGRVRGGDYASSASDGLSGAFFIPSPVYFNEYLRIIANTAHEQSDWWEHVSVSLEHRIPFWEEMCFVKDLFWLEEECVVQYHPPRSKHINNHPNVLHLWRNTRQEFVLPPKELV